MKITRKFAITKLYTVAENVASYNGVTEEEWANVKNAFAKTRSMVCFDGYSLFVGEKQATSFQKCMLTTVLAATIQVAAAKNWDESVNLAIAFLQNDGVEPPYIPNNRYMEDYISDLRGE